MTLKRIAIEEIGDVTVARFLDRKILDETNIQQIGQELFRLVDAGGTKKFVVSFERVEYLSSAAHGKLIAFHKKILAAAGDLALCGIRPEIYEVFSITRLNKMYKIFADVPAALEALQRGPLARLRCPVSGCAGIFECYTLSAYYRAFRLCCTECLSHVSIRHEKDDATATGARFYLESLEMPTYEGESIRLLPAGRRSPAGANSVSSIQIEGRLDLFAADVLRRAWKSLQCPGGVLVDLRKASEFSEAGAAALEELCADCSGEVPIALLVGDAGRETAARLAEFTYVGDDESQAVAALGEPAGDVPPFLIHTQPPADV